MDTKRRDFQENMLVTQKILYNSNVFAKFIVNRSTIDNEF